MSRFDGWLVRYIMAREMPPESRITVSKAAREACVRREKFLDALRDPSLIRQDARHLGIDADEMRDTYRWLWMLEAEREREESMVASGAARTPPKPLSERYQGSRTRLGAWQPHTLQRDSLGIPLHPVEHPEPEGEWHAGLEAAGTRYGKR